MTDFRIEKDTMGELEVPVNALYGAQTQRAVNNFKVSGSKLPEAFIRSLIQLKKSAAHANFDLGCISAGAKASIVDACDYLLSTEDLMNHFPVDVFQTGSGTSSNMNANEVIARLANDSGSSPDEEIGANDHVNYGQSSNDVIPSTIHISALSIVNNRLLPAIDALMVAIENKAKSLSGICKTGRTHLMDAMPVRMEQCLMSWHAQLEQQIGHLNVVSADLASLAIGGTAVGTGINAHPDFANKVCGYLEAETGIGFRHERNKFLLIGTQDTALALSGVSRNLAVSLMKIANDLRWMNSGPLAGLGEIALPALQPGSSIMPGKVNPVIPESVAMASAQVIGNDTAITIGAQSGNFELNVMLPMIAHNLLSSLNLMANSCEMLGEKAITGFTVNHENLSEALHKNPILVTALNPIIGYEKAAAIAKQAYKEKRSIIDVAAENTDFSKDELGSILDPMKLTYGGVNGE